MRSLDRPRRRDQRHLAAGHDFTLTVGLFDVGGRTLVTWRQRSWVTAELEC